MRRNALTATAALVLLPALVACKDKAATDSGATDSGGPWRPDLVCPGDEGCTDNSGALMAGAATLSITPTCFEGWDDVDDNASYSKSTDSFLDCGCDRLCADDEGYPGPDEGEEDGEFQAVWIAGFGSGRAANGIHDDLLASAVVLSSGDTSVALVALDLVGFFYGDAKALEAAAQAAGADVDRVVVHSSHNHEGPDTLGQWGRRVGETGYDPVYAEYVIDQAAAAIAAADAAKVEVTMNLASVSTATPFGDKGTRNHVRDSRDPVVIDEMMGVAHLTDSSGATVATLVNYGNHPEVLSSDNLDITSDFPHYLRNGVTDGVPWESGEKAGVGGVTIFVNAAVGGLMTPLGIDVTDGDGVTHTGATWENCQALGYVLADVALDGVAAAEPADSPTVSIKSTEFYMPIDNIAFQAAFLVGMFDRELYNYDPDSDLDDDNVPEVITRMDVVDIGPLRLLTIPGEIDPELLVDGYDGSRINNDQDALVEESNPNPPDLSAAPTDGFIKDRMGAEHNWIVGLGNDELGYLLAPYNYQLSETVPYLTEAEGDHYEETNSTGPNAMPLVDAAITSLLEWSE